MYKIVIIGAGQMASALSFPAFENGHEVCIVGTPLDSTVIDSLKASGYHPTLKKQLHNGIHYYQFEEMDDAIAQADLVVCGVSSFGVEWFGKHAIPRIPPHVPLLSVTKGLYLYPDDSLVPYPHYWNSVVSGKARSINAIGGACVSYELAEHVHNLVTFCGDDMNTLQFLKKLLETSYYHIHLTADVLSVEFSVAIKNLYALAVCLAVGIAEKQDGVGAHHFSTEAALFSQSVREMQQLILFFGGSLEGAFCCISDLYGTIYGGRTRKIGTLLGKGLGIDEAMAQLSDETLESIVITKRLAQAVRARAAQGDILIDQFPLLMLVDSLVGGAQTFTQIDWAKLSN